MNKILTAATFVALLFSCTPEKEGIEKLIEERDQVQTQYEELGARLAELNAQLEKQDTAKRYILITTMPVKVAEFQHYFEVQGNIEADKNVMLYPEAGGVIRNILVDEGERVKKGQVLVDLDTEIIELQIKEVETSLELATTTYERQKRLWDQKIGSEMQYLQAKNQKETLETNLASLNAQLRKNRIVAPFDGVVDEIFPKMGELTSPQTQVLRLVNLDKVYIKADVSEAYLGKVKEGTEVEVYFPAFDETVEAKIEMTGNFINPNNRTFKITVNIDNKDNFVKPNLMAYVKIKDFEKENALIVPERLIQEMPNGGKFVYTSENESGVTVVNKKDIKTGLSYQNETMVLSGISSNDIIVDQGARSIKDSQTVKAINN